MNTDDPDAMTLTRAEFATIKHAVHWLGTVYSSEVFFLFGFPLLLVALPTFKIEGPSKT